MKKLLFFLIPVILACVVFAGLLFFMNKESGKGALQVTSIPKSKVYLNGKLIGQTPLCQCEPADMLAAGDYTIRLVPEGKDLTPFEDKITITKSILTVVDRTFGQGAFSEGSIITLTPLSNKNAIEMLIMSFPENIEVFVDNVAAKNTPTFIKQGLTESDHEIKLKREGYKEKIIRIKTVKGYKLTMVAFLGVDPSIVVPTSEENKSATSAASLTPTAPAREKITILQTPTGFLRVRETSSVNGREIGRVTPGEIFDLVEEANGWFAITLTDGQKGWISQQYARKE